MFIALLTDMMTAPEIWCWRSIPELAELHRTANWWIFMAYLPLGIVMTLLAIHALVKRQTLIALFLASFGTFIWMCGVGHFFSSYVIDNATIYGYNAFWVAGYWHLATAVVSVVTAVGFITVVGLLWFSPTKMEAFWLALRMITATGLEDEDAEDVKNKLTSLNTSLREFQHGQAH